MTKIEDKKLIALALTMPKHEDFMIEQFRKSPEYALSLVQDEFHEYVETDDIRYLLSTLRKIAEAKGWSVLSRETGLSRSVLYAALSGERDPQISTVMKILKALGVQILTNILPLRGNKKPSTRSSGHRQNKEMAYG